MDSRAMQSGGAVTAERDEEIFHYKSSDSTVTALTVTSDASDTINDSFDEFSTTTTEAGVEIIEEVMHKDLYHENVEAETKPSVFIETKSDKGPNRSLSLPILPTYMSRNPGEIWFPECRDCNCCRGFKYGCACVRQLGSGGLGVCKCISGPSDDVSAMTVNPMECLFLQHQSLCLSSHSSSSYNSYRTRRHSSKSRRSSMKNRVDEPCRFFFSAGGCRNGRSCPYNHSIREDSSSSSSR